MESNINLLAVCLAAGAALALKYLWYSRFLFKEQHSRLTKNHKHATKHVKPNKPLQDIGLEFLLFVLTAFVIFHLINISGSFYFEFSPVTIGINTAFWVWVGFMLPLQINDMALRHRSWRLLIIDSGFRYFSLIIMALIIAQYSL